MHNRPIPSRTDAFGRAPPKLEPAAIKSRTSASTSSPPICTVIMNSIAITSLAKECPRSPSTCRSECSGDQSRVPSRRAIPECAQDIVEASRTLFQHLANRRDRQACPLRQKLDGNPLLPTRKIEVARDIAHRPRNGNRGLICHKQHLNWNIFFFYTAYQKILLQ